MAHGPDNNEVSTDTEEVEGEFYGQQLTASGGRTNFLLAMTDGHGKLPPAAQAHWGHEHWRRSVSTL